MVEGRRAEPGAAALVSHEPGRFAEFSRRYKQELCGSAAVDQLRGLGRGKVVTLLYGAHDPRINHAAVLLSVLRRPTIKKMPAAKAAR